MLSKNKIKWIRSLEWKKFRKEEESFLAEGRKLVGDLLGHFDCRLLVATEEWYASHPTAQADERIVVDREELSRASLLKAPQEVLAVFRQPSYVCAPEVMLDELCLALDDVQDPGNLGTIVRIADWFGIRHIFCSPATADLYNPKTVQATMGAMARVQLHYGPLVTLLEDLPAEVPVYGTFLDGDDLYAQPLSAAGLIVMGNEGNGISAEVARHINRRLLIPNYPKGAPTSESLNVAVATAVVCAEFRRTVSR